MANPTTFPDEVARWRAATGFDSPEDLEARLQGATVAKVIEEAEAFHDPDCCDWRVLSCGCLARERLASVPGLEAEVERLKGRNEDFEALGLEGEVLEALKAVDNQVRAAWSDTVEALKRQVADLERRLAERG